MLSKEGLDSKERIEYRIKTGSQLQIVSHLEDCDANFVPPLSSKVNIENYAEKLFENTVTFEAWTEDKLVGLVAAYVNNHTTKIAFISNVSVNKENNRKGIATSLLLNCISYIKQVGFSEIQLEVNRNNSKAIQLYQNSGFQNLAEAEEMLRMRLSLG